MAHAKNHDFHILPPSIWPFAGSVAAFFMLVGAVLWMKGMTPWMFAIGFVGVLYVMFGWWSDVVAESRVGDHTKVVNIGLRYGVILFITSELMFFVGWFWSFIKHAVYPMQMFSEGQWPPPGTEPFAAFDLPLINTLILLCSGAAVTWAHHALVHENNRRDLIWGLTIGIALGLLFTVFQAIEYSHAQQAMGSGSIYWDNFFMATGFHGIHVIIGTLFLFICLLRAIKGDFTPEKHIGFEAAAWYWHFVDVVWLFLFATIYIWGS